MWTKFEALPNYFGGKRKLIKDIFKHAKKKDGVFIDAFLGGGSVSLWAKARGYKVICNDIAERSVIVGKALIENSRVKITDEDLARLFVPAKHKSFIAKNFVPKVFLPQTADFLDNAFEVVKHGFIEGSAKQYLMLLLLLKFIQRTAANTGMPLLAKDDVNEIQKGYATYLSARNLMNTVLTTARKLITATNPAEALWQYAKINAGALTRTNTDAKVFLDTTKAFSSLLTRAAGEKGVLTNMDVQRIINGLPNPGDTKDIIEEKAAKFDALFKSQFQSAIQAYIGQTSGQPS